MHKPKLVLPKNKVARAATLVVAGLIVLSIPVVLIVGLTCQGDALTTMLNVVAALAVVFVLLNAYRVQEQHRDSQRKVHQDTTV